MFPGKHANAAWEGTQADILGTSYVLSTFSHRQRLGTDAMVMLLLGGGNRPRGREVGPWVCSQGESHFSPYWGPTFLPLGGACDPQDRPHSQKALSSCFSLCARSVRQNQAEYEGPPASPKELGHSMCLPMSHAVPLANA